MPKSTYDNYFTDHYKLSLQEKDILQYEQWFIAQWKFIQRIEQLKPGSRILEIGSGVGGVYHILKKQSEYDYSGIELDRQAVLFANSYFKSTRFTVSTIEEFRVGKSFDYVFAFEVLEHLHDPLSVVQKIHALLKPGGTFIGTSPYPFKKNIYADKTHYFVLHPDNWKRLFLYSGFSSVEVYPMSFFPFLWRMHSSLNIRLPFYVPVPGFISTSLIIAKKS